ncbi:hypothetical protein [Dactylosporangium sp. NPDC049140]|uniref:hypothetical protein n=1 Tax=Dactylosporangium sp. NPDC049140 TaxID=3155647 RepID=UPI0033C06F02
MQPIDPARGIAELDRAASDREAKWEKLLLLGTPDVVMAARAWHQSVWRLEWFVHGLADDTLPGERFAFFLRQDYGYLVEYSRFLHDHMCLLDVCSAVMA